MLVEGITGDWEFKFILEKFNIIDLLVYLDQKGLSLFMQMFANKCASNA